MLPVRDYVQPTSLEAAVRALSEAGGRARVLAGGTDLFVLMRAGRLAPDRLVSLSGIPGLDRLESSADGGLVLGTRVTWAALLEAAPAPAGFPAPAYAVLAEAAAEVGAAQTRNAGTLGGNLCHAAPSAEAAPPLLVLDATVEAVGPEGRRRIPIAAFFAGPNRTALASDEILAAVHLPAPPAGLAGAYVKGALRGAMEIAQVSVATALALGKDGRVAVARIALGAVAEAPFRAKAAEDVLAGRPPDEAAFAAAAEAAAAAARPITDIRASADYRRHIVSVLTRRALGRALERAREGTR